MDNPLEAFQVGGVNFTPVRIPPDLSGAGCLPDEARDLVTARDKVGVRADPIMP
jgi:hypothetical protein